MLATLRLIFDIVDQFGGCCGKRKIDRLKGLQYVKQASTVCKNSILLVIIFTLSASTGSGLGGSRGRI